MRQEPANDKLSYHYEEVTYRLPDESQTSQWLLALAQGSGAVILAVSYIFCSDEYLLQINKEYLDHDYYTDIITFPYKQGKLIESDIFVSIDRVADNALEQQVTFDQELLRVMAHGILHLVGHKDKTEEDATNMRRAEDEAIALYQSLVSG